MCAAVQLYNAINGVPLHQALHAQPLHSLARWACPLYVGKL